MKVEIGDLNPQADFLISRIEGCADLFFDNPASPQSANEHSITWIKKSKDIQEKIRCTKSSFVVGFVTTCKRNDEVLVSGDAKIFVPKT